MSTDRNRRGRILLGTVAACLLLAGCGDDDGGQEAAPTITSSTPTSAATPSTGEVETEVGDGGGGDFCQLSDELAGLFGELAQSGSEEIWVDIEAVVAQMQAVSPPELEADVATAIGYYPTARAELEAANWDVSVLDSLELEPDHAAAEENITAYLDATC